MLFLRNLATMVYSQSSAVIACLVMAVAYVGCLYLLPTATRRLPRDHHVHIAARCLAVILTSALCVAFFAWFSRFHFRFRFLFLFPLHVLVAGVRSHVRHCSSGRTTSAAAECPRRHHRRHRSSQIFRDARRLPSRAFASPVVVVVAAAALGVVLWFFVGRPLLLIASLYFGALLAVLLLAEAATRKISCGLSAAAAAAGGEAGEAQRCPSRRPNACAREHGAGSIAGGWGAKDGARRRRALCGAPASPPGQARWHPPRRQRR